MPGCVSRWPSRHPAGGGCRSTSSSKSMCRQGVMGPSWRLFLGNCSRRMGNPLSLPPRPGQPPPGLHGDPCLPAPPQGRAACYGGGEDACRIGPGWVGEGMDVARQPASSITMATPPHPSWDAARPDDEVISRGERGRQAGSGDLPGPGRHPNLPATVTRCTRKAGAARAGHPPRPPPSLHWGGQAALPIILLAAPARCLPERQNPHGAVQIRSHPSSQLPDGGWAREWESGGPDMQSPPPHQTGSRS